MTNIQIYPFRQKNYALYRDGRIYAIGPIHSIVRIAKRLRKHEEDQPK